MIEIKNNRIKLETSAEWMDINDVRTLIGEADNYGLFPHFGVATVYGGVRSDYKHKRPWAVMSWGVQVGCVSLTWDQFRSLRREFITLAGQ